MWRPNARRPWATMRASMRASKAGAQSERRGTLGAGRCGDEGCGEEGLPPSFLPSSDPFLECRLPILKALVFSIHEVSVWKTICSDKIVFQMCEWHLSKVLEGLFGVHALSIMLRSDAHLIFTSIFIDQRNRGHPFLNIQSTYPIMRIMNLQDRP